MSWWDDNGFDDNIVWGSARAPGSDYDRSTQADERDREAGPSPDPYESRTGPVNMDDVRARQDPRTRGPVSGVPNMAEPGRRYADMPGFDTSRINDPNEMDPKYVTARIVQNMGLQPTKEGLQTLLGELAKVFPGVRLTGEDQLDFSGVAGIERFGPPIPQDVIRDIGGAGAQWQFLNAPDGGGGGGGGGGGAAGGGGGHAGGGAPGGGGYHPGGPGGLAEGELVSPWDRQFAYDPYQPTEAFTETFQAPDYVPPVWGERFTAPTTAEMYQDPGIQFELEEGQKGIERSAAAGGTLLTGGTLKDISQYRQGLAATRYGDVYGRRASEYGQRYGEFGEAAGRGERASAANLNKNLAAYGTRRDVNREAYERGREAWQTNYGKARQEFDLARDIFSTNQANKYNRLYGLAQLGRF